MKGKKIEITFHVPGYARLSTREGVFKEDRQDITFEVLRFTRQNTGPEEPE
jgi:hypothetical protein